MCFPQQTINLQISGTIFRIAGSLFYCFILMVSCRRLGFLCRTDLKYQKSEINVIVSFKRSENVKNSLGAVPFKLYSSGFVPLPLILIYLSHTPQPHNFTLITYQPTLLRLIHPTLAHPPFNFNYLLAHPVIFISNVPFPPLPLLYLPAHPAMLNGAAFNILTKQL